MIHALKRVIRPLLHSMPRVERGIWELRALHRASADAKLAVRRLEQVKAAHPGRPLHGILLIEHIGDIIACEPVIGYLRKQAPDALIVWIVKGQYAELLMSHPNLDAVVTVESLASVPHIVRSQVFDAFFDLHVNNKPTGIGARFHSKRWGDPTISTVTYFEHRSLLRAFSKAGGLPALSEPPTMYISEATSAAVAALALPRPRVVVHARSNDDARDWSDEHWQAVARFILDECDLPVVEVGMQAAIRLEHPQYLSLCGKLSLMQTAEVIRHSGFFIGVDSGPAHMASAWRRPALLLFGRFAGRDAWCPYDGPYAEREDRFILRHPGPLPELSVETVVARLKSNPEWQALRSRKPSTANFNVG